MILKRFYEDKLAQASFLVGDPASGEAVVIDPHRDVEQYVRAAEAEHLRITAVTETHIHADFVSGSRDLAARVGAKLYLSDCTPEPAYTYANEPNVTLVRDGDVFRAGAVALRVLHTPGHSPEHISFVLTDEAVTAEPLGVFTGDFVFVGGVGRPDLLERAVGKTGTMEDMARTLFRALQRFKQLPGHLLLWPGHGAGSACGKGLGGVPVTTLAYELLVNSALRETDEQAFVADILAGQVDPPRYFAEMKRMNRAGPPRLSALRIPPRLDPENALTIVESGAMVVDLRRSSEFAKTFVPGVLHIPAGNSFTNWAGWLLPYDRPVYLLAGNGADIAASVRDLSLIGIDDVRGWAVTSTVLIGWAHRHGDPESVVRVSFADAMERVNRGAAVLLDVRERSEYTAGHVPGVTHIPLGHLAMRGRELPAEQAIAVHCAGGTRSAIAVSLLRRLGFTHLADVPGGFAEYARSGLPVETGEPSGVAAE